MSEPRFGAWTATADRVPDRPGLVICEWETVGGPFVGEARYTSDFTWTADGEPVGTPARWMPMPKPGETAGPGQATRALLKGLAEHLEDHGGEVNTMEAWVAVDQLEAALRECGIEVEP